MLKRESRQETKVGRKAIKGDQYIQSLVGTWSFVLQGDGRIQCGAHTSVITPEHRVTFCDLGEIPHGVASLGSWKTGWCAQMSSSAKRIF